MNTYELIDSLCEITSKQADIIRRQQAVIMQHGIEVADPVLERIMLETEDSLDQAEMNLRNV